MSVSTETETQAMVVDFPVERRQRKGLFRSGRGTHRRTPETWKRMGNDLEAALDRVAELEAQLMEKKNAAEAAEGRAQRMERAYDILRTEHEDLHRRVRELENVIGPDADNSANQITYDYVMPPRPEDRSIEGTPTQPMSQVDLLGVEDVAPRKTLEEVTPDPRIYYMTPPTQPAQTPAVSSTDATQVLPRVDQTVVMPIFNAPFALGHSESKTA